MANLYPFTETVASGASPDECVEQIDIGGPAMVRASAKNHDSVAVVVDPTRYEWVLEQVEAGGFTLADRRRLAAAAFRHTATYDVAVASWMGNVLAPDGDGPFPAWVGATWERASTLRYGENPHQAAALYTARHGAGWPARSSCTARRCRTTTTSTPTPRGGPRTTTATPLRRGHQAHQPVRDRGRRATSPRRTARRTRRTR